MITQSYPAAFARTWTDDTPAGRVRFVVLDSETTGFDAQKDSLITIGAVAVHNGEILIEDSCELMLRLAHNLASVTVHGITRDEARDGMEEAEALEVLLDYLRDAVIVGHHIDHDIRFLNVACERHFGLSLANRSLDTMGLSLRLHEQGALGSEEWTGGFSLDALCDRFAVEPHDRHTAGGDALLTAQIFLRLLRAADAAGLSCLGSLCEPYETGRTAGPVTP